MELKDYKTGDKVSVKYLFDGKAGTVIKADEHSVEVYLDEPASFKKIESALATVYLDPPTFITKIIVHNSYYIEKIE